MTILRRLLISIFLAFSFLIVSYPAVPVAYTQDQEVVFVGSRNSNKYHHPSCVWAKKIKPENLVTFNGKGEAVSAGYIPCKVCKP